MMLASTIKAGAAYAVAFVLAVAAGVLMINVLALAWCEDILCVADTQMVQSGLGFLAALAVFQLVFGLATGFGRSLLYWPVAMLVLGLSFLLGWLISLGPLGKADAEINDFGYGRLFIDSLQQAVVISVAWPVLTFVLGLIAALFVARRAFLLRAGV